MYQVSLKSEGVRPFFVITWPGITQKVTLIKWPEDGYINRVGTYNTYVDNLYGHS